MVRNKNKIKLTWSMYRHATTNPIGMATTWIAKVNDDYVGQVIKSDQQSRYNVYARSSNRLVTCSSLKEASRYLLFNVEPKPEPPPIVHQPKQEQVKQSQLSVVPRNDDDNDWERWYG
jgi:gluconate kinase